jgi:hypothetical protein
MHLRPPPVSARQAPGDRCLTVTAPALTHAGLAVLGPPRTQDGLLRRRAAIGRSTQTRGCGLRGVALVGAQHDQCQRQRPHHQRPGRDEAALAYPGALVALSGGAPSGLPAAAPPVALGRRRIDRMRTMGVQRSTRGRTGLGGLAPRRAILGVDDLAPRELAEEVVLGGWCLAVRALAQGILTD